MGFVNKDKKLKGKSFKFSRIPNRGIGKISSRSGSGVWRIARDLGGRRRKDQGVSLSLTLRLALESGQTNKHRREREGERENLTLRLALESGQTNKHQREREKERIGNFWKFLNVVGFLFFKETSSFG
ncbi:hypothetical protein L484_008501 [Morus notabilis]|uniref:Uncharacterized protein n=1 Tax=Morus notabilis TaxID=981085 RepID=W9RLI7_9ROSA|nr:hypothetical protein L484_008501 [Morus notabilis]